MGFLWSIVILFYMIMIWLGPVTISEPNKIVLGAEILALVLLNLGYFLYFFQDTGLAQ